MLNRLVRKALSNPLGILIVVVNNLTPVYSKIKKSGDDLGIHNEAIRKLVVGNFEGYQDAIVTQIYPRFFGDIIQIEMCTKRLHETDGHGKGDDASLGIVQSLCDSCHCLFQNMEGVLKELAQFCIDNFNNAEFSVSLFKACLEAFLSHYSSIAASIRNDYLWLVQDGHRGSEFRYIEDVKRFMEVDNITHFFQKYKKFFN